VEVGVAFVLSDLITSWRKNKIVYMFISKEWMLCLFCLD